MLCLTVSFVEDPIVTATSFFCYFASCYERCLLFVLSLKVGLLGGGTGFLQQNQLTANMYPYGFQSVRFGNFGEKWKFKIKFEFRN